MNFREHKIKQETKLLSFRIDLDVEAKLMALAKDKQWSLSNLVKNIVCDYVKNLE